MSIGEDRKVPRTFRLGPRCTECGSPPRDPVPNDIELAQPGQPIGADPTIYRKWICLRGHDMYSLILR